jgi:hypothetical protein
MSTCPDPHVTYAMAAEKRGCYLLLQVRSLESHGVSNDSEGDKVLIGDEFACGERAQAESKLVRT